jgi:hypothetical protein
MPTDPELKKLVCVCVDTVTALGSVCVWGGGRHAKLAVGGVGSVWLNAWVLLAARDRVDGLFVLGV